MKSMTIRFAILLLAFSAYSCKDSTSSNSETLTVETEAENKDREAKKVVTEDEKKVLQSVMTKIMIQPELSSFSSALVTAGLTEMLSMENGPYTIFAPSNLAFENLSEEKRKELYNQANLEQMKKIFQNHLVKGNLTASILRESKGAALPGHGGSDLVILTKGDELWVKDKNGKEAKIIQSDLSGNNGVIHVIDQLLNID